MASIDIKPADLIGMLNRQPVPTDKIHILLVSMPKSASTFLTSILDKIPQLNQRDLVPTYDFREQEIGRAELVMFHHQHYFAKCHVRNSGYTTEVIRNFSLTPVFTYRNIFDVIVSLADHYRKGDLQPMAIPPVNLATLTDSELLDFIVDYVAPWLVTFFVSWTQYQGALLALSYEEITKDTENSIQRLLSYAGIKFDLMEQVVAQAVKEARENKQRFNKGISGRGKTMLSEDQKQRVLRLTRFYPNLKFDLIGL